jgi:Periplasmic glycine betaine/choline-binding (lipo)protein of an ABC-type transport system (osmoprotectant binding protein)
MKTSKTLVAAGALATAAALAGCAGGGDTVVVGSQAYYSNEIVAEVYAQALEAEGFTVERNFQIGQRDAYIPALEAGEVDLFPEYTGNLLQFYSADTMATQTDEVYAELQSALPEQLTALAMSPATDQDSYNVTAEFAEANGLVAIGDLAGVSPLVLGGAPELEERPYGPQGLLDTYGVEVEFNATGEVTLDALLAGEVQVANIYTGNPAIAAYGLVTLEDPEGLFLASNLVPIVNSELAEDIGAVISPISEAMSADELVAMNLQSTEEQMSSADIAAEWLEANGF